jgi:hypothetical protein
MTPKQTAQKVFEENVNQNQFTASPTNNHAHTGIGFDGQKIDFTNLINRKMSVSYTLTGTAAATSANYSSFFIVPLAMTLVQATEVHTTAGSDGSAVTLQIEKLTGTTAPGSGTALLSSTFNLKGTANTVQTYTTFTPTVGAVQCAMGDRIALKLSGTPTAVANMTVTLLFNY